MEVRIKRKNRLKKRRNAFTLAEILVTFGVIGVVAAVTMPTLIQNYKKHVVETKLSKFYTTINQAIAMSTVQNGEPADWVKDCGKSYAITCTNDETMEWFKSYIGKYMSVSKIEPKEDDTGFFVYFNDGSIMFMRTYVYDILFYISKKAIDSPQSGVNEFSFRFMPKLISGGNTTTNIYTIKNTVEPNVYAWDGTLEYLYTEPRFGCKTDATFDRRYCTKIIQLNGWKIPKDYPLKF